MDTRKAQNVKIINTFYWCQDIQLNNIQQIETQQNDD